MNATPSPTAADRAQRVERLRDLVGASIAAATSDGILLSGGLDTSIVAAVAAAQSHGLRAVSVSVADAPGPDEPFATALAGRLGFELRIVRPSLADLIGRLPELIRLLETFDPMELRNSIVAYVALEAARDAGIRSALTGDAADELFAGYSYMFGMSPEQLPAYIRFLNGVMRFTSQKIGPALRVGVELPYLAHEIRAFALTLDAEDLIAERNGRRFGKAILRRAFADLLPEDVVWRVKTPIEYGSGSTALQKAATEATSDAEFERVRHAALADQVRLRDKEQYFYYRLYRQVFPPPRERPRGPKTCPDCQGPAERPDMRYCRICGAYPI